MAEAPREAWITGIGIVSCLGEGLDAHWQGLAENKRVIDTESFPPFIVHPLAPIASGQSDITLVGGSYNAERPDAVMLYEFGGYCLKGDFRPVWDRVPDGGFALGSLGAFIVVESRTHAQARGVKPIARLSAA